MKKIDLEIKIKKLEKEIKNLQNELNKKRNVYETVIVITENVKLKVYSDIIKKIKNILDILNFKESGLKKLAYTVKNNNNAFYIIIKWEGSEEDTKEIEKFCQKENNILKFITIKIEN